MTTLLLGNLDCESDWAALRPGGRRVQLPLTARRAISAFATLLRVFAESDDDLLWTPLPVDPARMADLPGLPRPRLVSGRRDRLSRADRTIAWGGTGETAARVNHRGFALEVATRLGVALPGAALLHSLHALDRHLEAGGADAAPGGRWVLKAPLSAAGRGRVFGEGRRPDARTEKHAARLLDDHDSFLFEPWMERIADFSAAARVTDDGVGAIRCHRQVVTAHGAWRGSALEPIGPDAPEVARAAAAAGAALFDAGYRGPYGVDAFRYRDAAGREALAPLVEINARHTFGHVAWRLRDRLSGPLGIPATARVALLTGAPETDAPPPGVEFVALLHPGEDDATTARLCTQA